MKSIAKINPEEDRIMVERMLGEINASNEDYMAELAAQHSKEIDRFLREMENEQPPDVTVLEEVSEDCPDQGKK